jgi:methionine--tRNA ligase beta chain
MDLIDYADFAKVDFRIGEIKEAGKVLESEKLLKLKVDFGEFGEKNVFSGIYKWYKPENLIGKKTVFVMNVKPKKIMGELSEAMIFAAGDEENDNVSILFLDKDVKNGTQVY